MIASADVTVNDVAYPGDAQVGGTLIEAAIPASVPAGSILVVEVLAPELDAGEGLFMGSNDAGETGPTYLRGPDCDISEPTQAAELNADIPMDWVLTVTGTAAAE